MSAKKKENEYFLDDVDLRKYSELFPKITWLAELWESYIAHARKTKAITVGVMVNEPQWKELQAAIGKSRIAKEYQKFSKQIDEMRSLD